MEIVDDDPTERASLNQLLEKPSKDVLLDYFVEVSDRGETSLPREKERTRGKRITIPSFVTNFLAFIIHYTQISSFLQSVLLLESKVKMDVFI